MNRLTKFVCSVITGESGQALLAALVMMTLSTLVIAPYLNFISTSVNAGKITEENVAGYYAAESGLEDGLWRLLYNPPASFPYSYQLTGINGMTVNVTIEQIAEIAGQTVGNPGGHEDWLIITKEVVYDSGTYSYTLSIKNNGSGNIKIEQILIMLPPEAEYITGSTGGDITSDDPDVVGNPDAGITLVWNIPSPYPTIAQGDTDYHYFQISGPAELEGVEGHSYVRATRDDVGTVWDADSKPYAVSAQAYNSANELVASVRTGVWKSTSGSLEISCWRVIR